jgi:hypothetical protein
MNPNDVTEIIREFSSDFEAKRMTKDQVLHLSTLLHACDTAEEARILAFCEVENLLVPEPGEFETLDDFRRQLKTEGVI